MQGFRLVALTGSAGADVLANKPVVAGDNEVRAESVQSLLNALVGVGVVELEDGGQRGRRRRDEDAPAAKDETLLDSPWGAASLRDGVAEAAQVVVVQRLEDKAPPESSTIPKRRRCHAATREHSTLGTLGTETVGGRLPFHFHIFLIKNESTILLKTKMTLISW